jgi:succinoglycan biosynthesis protein ExoM
MTTTDSGLKVSICICTFRRPALLEELLNALFEQDIAPAWFEVIVVDNDPLQSARKVLHRQQRQWQTRLTALHIEESNISLARNAAIQAAHGEWVAMLDDDEVPAHDWLSKLLETQATYKADAVLAPVVPRFAPEVPQWLREGGYFDRPRMLTGTRVPLGEARTGNVLIRRSSLLALCTKNPEVNRHEQGPFSVAYGLTGGEDTMLFSQLLTRRARLIWCDEAPVAEWIPAERGRAGWLLARSYRTGQIFMRTELAARHVFKRWVRGTVLGVRAVFQGLIALLAAFCWLLFSRQRAFRWLRIFSSQLGKLSALLGMKQRAYG